MNVVTRRTRRSRILTRMPLRSTTNTSPEAATARDRRGASNYLSGRRARRRRPPASGPRLQWPRQCRRSPPRSAARLNRDRASGTSDRSDGGRRGSSRQPASAAPARVDGVGQRLLDTDLATRAILDNGRARLGREAPRKVRGCAVDRRIDVHDDDIDVLRADHSPPNRSRPSHTYVVSSPGAGAKLRRVSLAGHRDVDIDTLQSIRHLLVGAGIRIVDSPPVPWRGCSDRSA